MHVSGLPALSAPSPEYMNKKRKSKELTAVLFFRSSGQQVGFFSLYFTVSSHICFTYNAQFLVLLREIGKSTSTPFAWKHTFKDLKKKKLHCFSTYVFPIQSKPNFILYFTIETEVF